MPHMVRMVLFTTGANLVIALQYKSEIAPPTFPAFGDLNILNVFITLRDWFLWLVARAALEIPGASIGVQTFVTTFMVIGYAWPLITNFVRGSSSE